MDLRDLLDVKAICDAGSFRKAAQSLGVSQPTLSNRVACLEGRLGARLFERDHSRSRPTHLAEIIASRVATLGQDAALLHKEVARLASGRTGFVRIGFGPAAGRILVDKVVDQVTTQHPDLSVSVTFGSTNQLSDHLRSRDLDIVVSHPFESPHHAIHVEREVEIENIIVAHPGHVLFQAKEPGIREIVKTTPMAITVLEKRYQDLVLDRFRIDVNRLPGSVVCSDWEMLIRLVASRPLYFTAGPALVFAPELTSGRLRRLASPLPFGHRVAIHTNREALSLPAVAHLHRIVLEVFTSTLGLPDAN